MSLDQFLALEKIEGEAQDDAHANEIDVLSWSWGMSQSGSMHVGGGGGAGKASFLDLSVTKWVDAATSTLMLYIAKGTHIPTATLVVRKAGDKPLEYVKITMTDVLVTSLSTGGSGGEDRLTENLTLNFAEVKVEYQKQKPDGSGEAGKEFAWNIPKNIPK